MVYAFWFFNFFLGIILSLILTPFIRDLAFKYNVLDIPRPPRNLHKNKTPYMGGIVIVAAFIMIIGVSYLFDYLPIAQIESQYLLAILISSLVILLGGILDDIYNLPAKIMWLFPVLAALISVYFGIGQGITTLSNPLGGAIKLEIWGLPLGAALSFLWLIGMSFTTKLLDGLDGLVSGISLIASIILFFVSLLPHINQSLLSLMSLSLAGILIGYLFYAFKPAKIFLGESGSVFLGYILGIMSILIGAKMAIAFLIMGIPIIDAFLVIVYRLWSGKSPFVGDRKHLHFRLLDMGFSETRTVILMYVITLFFGVIAVLLQTKGKFMLLFGLIGVMICLLLIIYHYSHKKNENNKKID